ncbi:MAG: methionine adenosyltransferase [Rhodobacteraceae bacterium]|nr:methionine adenosyltransferase [Paracoccaceae bacterium]
MKATRKQFDFTSESVSEGHPDKVCDRISDTILDEIIKEDPMARVACEAFATTNKVILGGEVGFTKKTNIRDFSKLLLEKVRSAVREIGYEQEGFHWEKIEILNFLHEQSPDIAQGVENDGAGDQGIMFGYAVDETPELMPAPLQYSQAILKRLSIARRNELKGILGPDSKSQLTISYEDGKPSFIKSIVVSTQHLDAKLTSKEVKEIISPYVVEVLPKEWLVPETIWHVNPTGKFVVGGPDGDAGLTGRKIIVDTYGGAAPHGGGAFSGKDPTKVDRSAAYAARYLAKNIVAAGLAKKCVLQLSYAIGVPDPLSVYVNTSGSSTVPEEEIEQAVLKAMDLSPSGIISHLNLRKPIYAKTAAYGHFGQEHTEEGHFSWEKTDLVDSLLMKINRK